MTSWFPREAASAETPSILPSRLSLTSVITRSGATRSASKASSSSTLCLFPSRPSRLTSLVPCLVFVATSARAFSFASLTSGGGASVEGGISGSLAGSSFGLGSRCFGRSSSTAVTTNYRGKLTRRMSTETKNMEVATAATATVKMTAGEKLAAIRSKMEEYGVDGAVHLFD